MKLTQTEHEARGMPVARAK